MADIAGLIEQKGYDMFHRKNKRQKKSQEMLDIDLMEEIGYYQKKPQKKGLDQKIVIALVLGVVVAACVLFSH